MAAFVLLFFGVFRVFRGRDCTGLYRHVSEHLMIKTPANSIRGWLTSVGLALLFSSASLLAGQAAEVRYNVIKIIEGNGTTVPEAGGINQKGQVVGSIDGRGSPNFWRWSNGVREDLPLGNGRSGLATALNNQGQVTGAFYTGEFFFDVFGDIHFVYHAFVWNAGSIQDLGTLGGWDSSAVSINDQGVVLGAADTQNDRIPFITQNGQMRSLQSLITNPSGWKLALETHYAAADGRIWGLGTFGFPAKHHIYEMTPVGDGTYRIRSRGVIETIDVVLVFAFNEYGLAVGRTRLSGNQGGAFFWDGNTTVFLGNLGMPGSFPYALNNLGQVVGMSMTESQWYEAFLWENGVMFNLNNLIPSDSGIVLTKAGANSINDAGNIVCTYRNVASGFYGICLLVPVPPVPLEITRYQLTPAGLSLEVQGGAGQPLAVEYTSDWAQWTTLATSTNLFGRRTFIDPNATNSTFRAYRARLHEQSEPQDGR